MAQDVLETDPVDTSFQRQFVRGRIDVETTSCVYRGDVFHNEQIEVNMKIQSYFVYVYDGGIMYSDEKYVVYEH